MPGIGFDIRIGEVVIKDRWYAAIEVSQVLGVTRLYQIGSGITGGFIGFTGITAKGGGNPY